MQISRLRFGVPVVLLAAFAALGPPPAPVAAQAAGGGTLLVAEPFTGAAADPRFQGFGSACLTGAPAAGGLGDGLHPLAACGADRVGPVPPAGGAPFGFLELTDAANDQAGAVLFDQALPAVEGLEVTFDQYQYGSTTPDAPADGISFFLVDGAGGLSAPGAFGGSLGYAQKEPGFTADPPFIPGVDNGYLGIGLDVLGNYFGDWERRGDGCATPSPSGTAFYVPAPGENMVTVRGPGDGTEGYCFLTATTDNLTSTGPWNSTLPGELHGPLTALPPGADAEEAAALLEPSKRTVTVRISPAPAPHVTVDVDFHDGAGPVQVIDFPAPEPVPETYKFGFAASTGLFTDVHLIGGLTVRSERPLPMLELVKEAGAERAYAPGETVEYTYTLRNTTGVTVPDVAVVDDRIADLDCEATTLAPAGAEGDTVTCTGAYPVTDADAEAGEVTNTAEATGDGGRVVSNAASVTVAVAPGGEPGEPGEEPGLAETGPSPAAAALLALALAAAGLALLRSTRRAA
ncbi:DUF7507 domain-containing protein [Glycomyces paridis]|uniref:DUF7507 domain-containing protein n=1 Tax=Glycomyces paridis TaxID=2126555 RepID=A0A4S8PDI9_9ACTN|nr:hypothetical protein [Glycomyces paridis]THV28443.1 hypothetical protein E9998_12650 [Glycomyces paridis]